MQKAAASHDFQLKFAETDADLRDAQRLRYQVFVSELGGGGPDVDHAQGLERDRFDPFVDHLMLLDRARAPEDQTIGVYRLMRQDQATCAGGFYSAGEYDLGVLLNGGRRLLELGRSCLHPDYRGGTAMFELWAGLTDYVMRHKIDVLFGVASFHGTDLAHLAQPLSLLHQNHLAPEPLRVRALQDHFQSMDLVPAEDIDRKAAMRMVPPLIKAYLRLGGSVGEGAFIDHAFNTTDICMIMDTAAMSARHAQFYRKS